MDTSIGMTRLYGRKPLAALGKLSLAAPIGIALLLIYLQVALIGQIIPPLAVFAVVSSIVAGIIATGRRWAPLLGALWCGFIVAGNAENITYNLAHPADTHSFAFTVIMLLVVVVGIVSGIGATAQNYFRATAERRAPRWLSYGLTALAALAVGAILVAAIPQTGTAGVSAEALAGLPALATEDFRFSQSEIRAKVGETVALRLDNNDREVHSFDIDAFNVHAPMPVGESSLALFKATEPGTYTFYCGVPGHTEAGMVGTLIVE